jgi:hypothetical protein
VIPESMLRAARWSMERSLVQLALVTRDRQGLDENGILMAFSEMTVHEDLPCRLMQSGMTIVPGSSQEVPAALCHVRWGSGVLIGDSVIVDGVRWRVMTLRTGPLSACDTLEMGKARS